MLRAHEITLRCIFRIARAGTSKKSGAQARQDGGQAPEIAKLPPITRGQVVAVIP